MFCSIRGKAPIDHLPAGLSGIEDRMTNEHMKIWDGYAMAALNALVSEGAQAQTQDINAVCGQAAKLADAMLLERAKRENIDVVYGEIERAIDA